MFKSKKVIAMSLITVLSIGMLTGCSEKKKENIVVPEEKTIEGKIVDQEGGKGIKNIKVSIPDLKVETKTSEFGMFIMTVKTKDPVVKVLFEDVDGKENGGEYQGISSSMGFDQTGKVNEEFALKKK